MVDYTELEEIELQSSTFLKKRLLFWAIRWIIGFSIIGAITYKFPQHYWLWWAGLTLAGLSLGFLVLGGYFLNRKISSVQSKIENLEKLIDEDEIEIIDDL